MLKVLKVNKRGNRLINYTCTDGRITGELTKEQLSNYIARHQVMNATQQIYKGQLIIRVKNDNMDRVEICDMRRR